MKKRFAYILIFLFSILMLLPFLGKSQGGTWPVKYNDSDPSGAPSAAGTRLYFNTATNTLFTWEPAPSSTWRKQPKAFDQVSGCAAPAYTPTARQSTFAVNACTPPELYQYTGSAWECLNCVDGLNLTAGANITLTGTAPDITISADGDGNGIYGGSGMIPDGTVATRGLSSLIFGGDAADRIKINFTSSDGFYNHYIQNDGDGTIFSDVYDNGISPRQSVTYTANVGTASFDAQNANISFGLKTTGEMAFNGGGTTLKFDETNRLVKFDDQRDIGLQVGIEYAAYYPDIESNDPSIPSVQNVKALIASENGALGTGFTAGGGSGTIPAETVVTPQGLFSINTAVANAASQVVSIGDVYNAVGSPGGPTAVIFTPGGFTFGNSITRFSMDAIASQAQLGTDDSYIFIDETGIVEVIGKNDNRLIDDQGTIPHGLEYAGYYPAIETNNPSLTSTENVNSLKQKLVQYTTTDRDLIDTPANGYIIFCTDATADDSSTGVMQVWNGSAWKNAW